MARITLLRHGKSENPQAGFADFDRALNNRGQKNADNVGKMMMRQKMLPDLVLVSPAVRTKQTYEIASQNWSDIPMEFVDSLYEATANQLMYVIEERAGQYQNVLVIGHNPSLVVLLNRMVGSTHTDNNLSYFPTCCLADIGFEADRICDINPEDGRLLSIIRARSLDHHSL
ncbi:MAG: histidine phosphatase family protein [Candidatus Puniceispirillum sp.]|jgi:phosphohistidine phosphatase|uniref:SixA phosphatase family protein n=1 Tax=Candidatus Puniceispirillum sp. TaxID=2026719 RepID=UPI001EBCC5E2|nr:histidine phosphatase family protein [Candidatus Puniceispirillum sp.]MBT6416117.1 histidine phosphatase family protein [Candidatus Puniceispirillum sp.]MBT6566897.1 histidine phosphatase family protein [Candidatus Puniceispirillum sp.]